MNLVAGPAASCRAVPPVCLAKADRGLRGEPDTASFVNASAMSQPVLIVVGSYSPSPGDADFSLSTVTLPPPPGDSCSTATPLTSGTTLAAQTLTDYGDDVDDGDRCASAGFVGTAADRFYSVALPTGKQLTVTVTPQPGLDVVYVGQEQQLAAVVRKHVCTPSAGSTSTSEVAVIVLGEQVQAWVNASENQKSLVFIGPIASSSR